MSLNLAGLKVVVFDWDNTLAESRSALVYAINQVLPLYGLPEWEIIKCVRDNNLSFHDNFSRIFGEKAQEAYQKYLEVYKQNVGQMIKPFPHTTEVLRFFKQHGILVMIMTNKDRQLLEFELPFLYDRTLFDNIVCGHEAEQDKPCREHLFYTVKNVMPPDLISAQNVWVIGDSPQDSNCAKNAGARAIRIGLPIWVDDVLNLPEDIEFYPSFTRFYNILMADNNLCS